MTEILNFNFRKNLISDNLYNAIELSEPRISSNQKKQNKEVASKNPVYLSGSNLNGKEFSKFFKIYRYFQEPLPIYISKTVAACFAIYTLNQHGDLCIEELQQIFDENYPEYYLSFSVLHDALKTYRVISGHRRSSELGDEYINNISSKYAEEAKDIGQFWYQYLSGETHLIQQNTSVGKISPFREIYRYFQEQPPIHLGREVAVFFVLFTLIEYEDACAKDFFQLIDTQYPKYYLSSTTLHHAIQLLRDEEVIQGYWQKEKSNSRPKRMFQVSSRYTEEAKIFSQLWLKYLNKDMKIDQKDIPDIGMLKSRQFYKNLHKIPPVHLCEEVSACLILYTLIDYGNASIEELFQEIEIKYPGYFISESIKYSVLNLMVDEGVIQLSFKKSIDSSLKTIYKVDPECFEEAKELGVLWKKFLHRSH